MKTKSYISTDAVIIGNVTIGKDTVIMPGAKIIAEDDKIIIGENCVILENAVIRSTPAGPIKIGDNCLVGPNTHLVSCIIDDDVFIATGVSIFHKAHVKKNCEIRINAVVHTNSVLSENTTVPIGWVAVGNPTAILPSTEHEKIWELQKPLNFPTVAYGLNREEANMKNICKTLVNRLKKIEISNLIRNNFKNIKIIDENDNNLKKILESIIQNIDLKKYLINPNGFPYGRNLLYNDQEFEILLMNWEFADESDIHDHGNSLGMAYVIEGHLKNYVYDDSFKQKYLEDYKKGEFITIKKAVFYKMENLKTTENSITLHIYSPPISGMKVYEMDTQNIY